MDELDFILNGEPEVAHEEKPKLFNSDVAAETRIGLELGLQAMDVHGVQVIPNSLPSNSRVPERNFDRHKFCEMLSLGKTEDEALDLINVLVFGSVEDPRAFKMPFVTQLRVKDDYFEEMIKEAKRMRADTWFNGNIKTVHKTLGKDDVPAEKLKFEMRKYLAAIDNPDKYAEKKASVDLNVNVFGELKRMKASDAKKMIEQFDPFIEAEFEEVRTWDSSGVEAAEGDETWAGQEVED